MLRIGRKFFHSATSDVAATVASTLPKTKPASNTVPDKATSSATEEVVPDVMVTLGIRMDQVTFVSHPGVMAVSKLLEMPTFVTPRTIFTQENVDAIKEFDEVLASKAQIALDNNLAMNFLQLEHIDKPGVLEMFLNEKNVLEAARKEVLAAPKNVYTLPKALSNYKRPEISRAFRPELDLDKSILNSTPEGKEYLRVEQSVTQQLKNGKPLLNQEKVTDDKQIPAQ